MTGMKFVGIEQRARDARTALNRLRWEVDHAIAQGRAADVAAGDLAEAVGILANILEALAAALPAEPADELEAAFGAARDRFVGLARYYTEYHRVPR